VAEALDCPRLELAAILMTRHDGAAHTGGHIAYFERAGIGAPGLVRGDTIVWAGRRTRFEGSDELSALRTWKNEFR
jgi:hypothetical protein